MFERPRGGELAILVHVDFSTADVELQEDLSEFQQLALAAGAQPVVTLTASRRLPEAKYFVGTGKAEEIRQCVSEHKAELILINHALSSAQERNLEKLCRCRVLDRTGLILDIFAQRARTFEGKLQVELAQLKHLSTRLVRGWTHLERQKGGIGLRGPGETQLESDRRMVRARITTIQKRLEKVRGQREQSRRARRKYAIPTVSLVGYTNAGKSTLFNCLTGAEVYVADKLFATLDPTLRRLNLPNNHTVILADTVGFIRHLPHDLVDAFRATLEETREANLLIHVIDASAETRKSNVEQVEKVLAEIGAEHVPILRVYNKIDLLPSTLSHIDRDPTGQIKGVWLSAQTRMGVGILPKAISEILNQESVYHQLRLTPEQGQLRGKLYQMGVVLSEEFDENGNSLLELRLTPIEFERLFK